MKTKPVKPQPNRTLADLLTVMAKRNAELEQSTMRLRAALDRLETTVVPRRVA